MRRQLIRGLVVASLFTAACNGNPNDSDTTVIKNEIRPAAAAGAPVFVDDFNRSGALGASWTVVDGYMSASGSAAVATSGETFAMLNGFADANAEAEVSLSTPLGNTWVGVFVRGNTTRADRDHYSAYVTPSGLIQLGRRNDWSYTYLATGAAFPSGTHRLSLAAYGANPVQLSVRLDGNEVLHHTDASASAVTGSGPVGVFDYEGIGQPIDDFVVRRGATFADDFDRSGSSLGTNWSVTAGTFTISSGAAHGTSASSYAFWTGLPTGIASVYATLKTPLTSTYAGVVARGQGTTPERDHYAAYIAPDGSVRLGRRNNYVYATLVTGSSFPSGTHELGLQVTGANPVQISVTLDGAEVIHYNDSSTSALTSSGKMGIFDYNGTGQAVDNFFIMAGSDFVDDFNRAALGSNWSVHSGTFSDNGSSAVGSVSPSYAVRTGSTGANQVAGIKVAPPSPANYVGVIVRGLSTDADKDHYAGYVGVDGKVHIARRNGWVYTYLANATSSYPSGNHLLTLSAFGTDPVQLSLAVDGIEILHYDDSSASRITAAGSAGIFDYNGLSQPIDDFWTASTQDAPPSSNVSPVIASIPNQSVTAGSRLRFTVSATDANGDTVGYSASSLPSGATLDPVTGIFDWTPSSTQVGSYTVAFTANDGNGGSDSEAAQITVASAPAPSCGTQITTFETGKTPTSFLHVKTTGSDTGSCGSPTSPCKTISKAVSLASPGTSILVHSGTYGYDYIDNVVGTASAPIWIGGVQGQEKPIFTNPTGEGLKFSAPLRYVVLHDMEVRITTSHGINMDDGGDHDSYSAASDIVISGIYLHDVGDGNNIDNCLKLSGVNNFYVLDSTFNHCGNDATSGGGTGIDMVGCHWGLVARNKFTGRKAAQTKGGSRDIEMRWNYIAFLQRYETREAIAVGGESTAYSYFRPSLSSSGDSDGLHYEARDIRLIANVIVGGKGISMAGCVDCLVANNSVILPEGQLFKIVEALAVDPNDTPGFTMVKDGRIFNNIFYYDKTTGFRAVQYDSEASSQFGTWDIETNLYFNRLAPSSSAPGWPTGLSDPTGIYGQDPDFLDDEEFFIDASSPAYGGGTSLSEVTVDRSGVCYRTPPSIGAHEVP